MSFVRILEADRLAEQDTPRLQKEAEASNKTATASTAFASSFHRSQSLTGSSSRCFGPSLRSEDSYPVFRKLSTNRSTNKGAGRLFSVLALGGAVRWGLFSATLCQQRQSSATSVRDAPACIRTYTIRDKVHRWGTRLPLSQKDTAASVQPRAQASHSCLPPNRSRRILSWFAKDISAAPGGRGGETRARTTPRAWRAVRLI